MITSRRRSERGQAMTEMALLITVFLGFLLGIIHWSWTMWEHETIVSRAAQAARWVAVRSYDVVDTATSNGAKDIVLYGRTPCSGCTSTFGLTADNVSVQPKSGSYQVDTESPTITNEIVVTVSGYKIERWFGGVGFTGRPITASAFAECIDTACSGT